MGSADRVLADYAVGLMVLLNFAGARHARFALLERAAPAIRRLSAHTFTLYLSHGVVIGLWETVFPVQRGRFADIFDIALAIVLVTVMLQPLTETLQRVLWRSFTSLFAWSSRGAQAGAESS
jgi:hypothetical protein